MASRCFYVIDMINHYVDIYRLGAHLMLCSRSWHFPGNPKLVWHPARLIKEGGCVDQSKKTPATQISLGTLWI